MNAAKRRSSSSDREPPGGMPNADSGDRQTPNTDMQDEDAGTTQSGSDGRSTAAQSAMKQTSKTQREGGSKR